MWWVYGQSQDSNFSNKSGANLPKNMYERYMSQIKDKFHLELLVKQKLIGVLNREDVTLVPCWFTFFKFLF